MTKLFKKIRRCTFWEDTGYTRWVHRSTITLRHYIKAIWHKAASSPRMDRSIVFVRWLQRAPPHPIMHVSYYNNTDFWLYKERIIKVRSQFTLGRSYECPQWRRVIWLYNYYYATVTLTYDVNNVHQLYYMQRVFGPHQTTSDWNNAEYSSTSICMHLKADVHVRL